MRKSVIHSGSFLWAEISRTTSSSSPRRVRNTEATSSWKPYLYSPTLVASSSCGLNRVAAIRSPRRLVASQPPDRDDYLVVGGGSASYLGASIEMRGHAAGIP